MSSTHHCALSDRPFLCSFSPPVILNVYNSGRPIAEGDREKIFDRFGRIDPLEGPTPDGVGLGLCLCREIILDHGGEIWYEARPDGSNFVFTISREDE
jgi:two-component system, OmpR family, sensor kinase